MDNEDELVITLLNAQEWEESMKEKECYRKNTKNAEIECTGYSIADPFLQSIFKEDNMEMVCTSHQNSECTSDSER